MTRRRWLSGAALTAAACSSRKPQPLRGFAFVAGEEDPELSVIDLNAFAFRRAIALEGVATQVVLDSARGVLYALAPAEPALYEIDARQFTRRRKLTLPSPAVAISPASSGWIWCLLRGQKALAGVRADSLRVEKLLSLPAEPAGFDRLGDQAAVGLQDGSLALVDLAAGTVSRPLAVARQLGNLRFRSDGKQVLAADLAARQIVIVDTTALLIVTQLQLAVRPDNFCFKHDGGQLFLTGEGRDAFVVVYPYRAEVGLTQLSGRAPGAMAASVNPDYLFVANPAAGSVTIFDIETQRVVAVTAVGAGPSRIVITPDQQYALVLNRMSGDIAVIRTATIAPGRAKSAPLFTMIPAGRKPCDAAILL